MLSDYSIPICDVHLAGGGNREAVCRGILTAQVYIIAVKVQRLKFHRATIYSNVPLKNPLITLADWHEVKPLYGGSWSFFEIKARVMGYRVKHLTL